MNSSLTVKESLTETEVKVRNQALTEAALLARDWNLWRSKSCEGSCQLTISREILKLRDRDQHLKENQ